MIIAILSDLHIEGAKYTLELPTADKIILAGDIISSHKGTVHLYDDFINRVNSFYGERNVIEIDGNHKGYGGSVNDFTNSQILVKDYDNNVAIIAATLWSGDHSEYAYKYLNDSKIPGFNWDWMRNRHQEDLDFITKSLEDTRGMKQVVVTHHLPSRQCVHPKWLVTENDPFGDINLGFYTDLDWVINKFNPKYWVFGHTHDSVHKFHSNGLTQLVCNPRGYRRRDGSFENSDFDPYKIIEVI